MKLRLIAEVQHKFPTTNMDRSNASGVYGASGLNDYYHLVHPGGQGHGKRHHRKKPKKTKVKSDV